MKKISLYIVILLAMVGFTACDEDYKDWADPQSNDPESPVEITFEATNASSTTFDLGTITTDYVAIAQTSLEIEEGNTVTYEVYVDQEEQFTNKLVYDMVANDEDLTIAVSDLQEATTTLYGKNPLPRELFIRIDAFVNTPAGQVLREHSNTLGITVTPSAPVIESAYYLIGGINNWDINNLENTKFTHSGNDVYDDPVFTLVVFMEQPEEGEFDGNFKIVPESSKVAASWDGVLGSSIDQNPEPEGELVVENAGSMKILEPGLYRITLNMMDYRYTIERLGDSMPESTYYITGDIAGGWGPDNVVQFTHSGQDVYDDPIFTLTIQNTQAGANFKIIPESGVLAGGQAFWDSALGTAVDGDTSLQGSIMAKGETDPGAIGVSATGWVRITINMMAFTYTIEPLGDATPMPETMYMIGTPWSWNWENVGESMVQVHTTPGKFWTMQYFDANAEIKFNTIKGWGGDFGYNGATFPETSITYAGLSAAGDGNIIVGNGGWYLVVVTTAYADESQTSFVYTIEFLAPNVYTTGNVTGGWDVFDEARLFTVPADGTSEFISQAFVASDNLRMCVRIEGVDWWKTEFNIYNGNIVYRASGNDQDAVAVTQGQRAYLNFSNNTGRIQ